MGRLEMMAPYLAAHPHVKVHVPPIFLAAWEPNHPAMIWSTAAGFGDRRRFVTGRILARVAHLPDRAQSGPAQHPLQYLAVKDIMQRILHREVLDRPSSTQRLPKASRPVVLLVKRLKSRRVINFDELHEALLRTGVDVIIFAPPDDAASRRTLAQALALWSAADAVVAPHGAGLTNTLALRSGATVIESIPGSHAGYGLYYPHLAHWARLQHHLFVVSGGLSTPIVVDIPAVVAALCKDIKCPVPPPPLYHHASPPCSHRVRATDVYQGRRSTGGSHVEVTQRLLSVAAARVVFDTLAAAGALLPDDDGLHVMPCGNETHLIIADRLSLRVARDLAATHLRQALRFDARGSRGTGPLFYADGDVAFPSGALAGRLHPVDDGACVFTAMGSMRRLGSRRMTGATCNDAHVGWRSLTGRGGWLDHVLFDDLGGAGAA